MVPCVQPEADSSEHEGEKLEAPIQNAIEHQAEPGAQERRTRSPPEILEPKVMSSEFAMRIN